MRCTSGQSAAVIVVIIPAGYIRSMDLAPSAGVAIRDAAGRILLGRRADDGTWCLPGGRLDPGESFAECARRECREELGREVELTGLAAVLSDPATQTKTYPDGRTVHFVGVVFRGRLGARVAEPDAELAATGWFGPGELPEEIMAADLPAIRHVLGGARDPLVD